MSATGERSVEGLERCAEPAVELGCAAELGGLDRLLREPPAGRQRASAGEPPDFEPALEALAAAYAD